MVYFLSRQVADDPKLYKYCMYEIYAKEQVLYYSYKSKILSVKYYVMC